jgi:CRP-like cAMP-binding protein
MRAGDASETDYLVLVIDGEVTVQNAAPGAAEGQVVTVLGPGSLIGTMGLIDGSPRSATCTAATDLAVGVLTRAAMLELIRHKPEVGARLLLAIAKQLSDDVRDANRKLLTLSQLTRALQQELDATHAVNRRLLEGGSPPAPTAG